ncbi:hypothetical protein LCGC14_2492250 [marine sediment metagenome]|uniref:Uncharacterized protein n=1 Tax=marine sediment metagenome TaxID=412755 RepID=A0A0F9DY73_9ZZZZ
MALMARGIDYYSQVTQYGYGAAANTGFMISGSSSKNANALLASGSRDIVQSDDEFLWGHMFNRDAGNGEDSLLGFAAIDSSQITLGAPVAGAVRLTISTANKQVVICYRKVNDR